MEYAAVLASLISFGIALYALVLSRRVELQERSERWSRRRHETERMLIYELVREVEALRESKIRELMESDKSIRQSIYA